MGKTVLIIDDDINDRMLIKRSVQSRNDNDIEFIELKTAKEALETINNRNDIDYIFLDYIKFSLIENTKIIIVYS